MKQVLALLLIAVVVLFSNCSKSSDPLIHVNCDSLVTDTAGTGDNGRVYMPNAFSPNNDGLNDICRPVTQNIDSITFTIYDESNAVLFTTTSLGQGWQPYSTTNSAKKYYYRIQATTLAGKKIGKCGEVFSLTCFPVNPPKSYYYFEDMLTPGGFTGTTGETLPTCR